MILRQLLRWQPDIIGLSEFRGTAASQQLATRLAEAGIVHQLTSVNTGTPAKNALLLASRYPLQRLTAAHMPTLPERWILAKVETKPSLAVGLMHVPNYTTPTLKYPFLDSILKMTEVWDRGPTILGGDTNCGKRGIDEEKPSPPKFQREHDFIIGMEERGWVDAFRHKHGDCREYTWYSHRNNGFRLDFAFLSPDLAPALAAARHEWGIDGSNPQRRDALSDHAALIIEMTLANK
ncbi:endonuclease/exonuclease/phosphatase family protein [Chloroflexi bacterium TSY]|nr:endonuclease/exonuclease/phosphatase family protein [Chloroflexi bacterium TSY]